MHAGEVIKIEIILCELIYRYKDIRELIRRCETLVASRDNLLKSKNKLRSAVKHEDEDIRNYKEEKNAHILDLSAKLNEMQEKYYGFEAKKLEKQRVIDAEVKDEVNKQLTIANIRLSILTLWQYVFSRNLAVTSLYQRGLL